MGWRIFGKTGGRIADVTTFDQLLVSAMIESEFEFISEKTGESFIWTIETYNYDAADTILSVRNIHATKKLHIHKIILHGDTETEVEIHVPTTDYTPTGTAVVGQGLNRTFDVDATAYATAIADETGQATQGDVIERVRIKADTDMEIPFNGALILNNKKAVGVDYVTVGGEAHISIWGFFKED
ncbi:hypothetical protein LCGC14_1250720 [marine sediment metagenome]|uniref:Uncharacterized protein n=1 Tax=marine sediment metagenome TaxID=412755 RepID=A0A0F9P726_9ZZZZ